MKLKSFNLIEVMVVIAIVAIIGAMFFSAFIRRMNEIDKARRKAESPKAEDPPNHIIFKTNYLIISGIEEDPNTELPPGYVILTNEWGGFSFRDGDGITHPFWADGAWETEEKAIRAAWLSHSRRIKERNGQLRTPNYTIVRTNQTK